MKKFLVKLLPFLLFPLGIGIINYWKDPANIFHPQYESGIVSYILRGYNVTNVLNYNERRLQKYFIQGMRTNPHTIAVGSSRIMELNKADVHDTSFINNGMSGATFEDELAICDLYENKGYQIHKIIIDLDPWMLNDNHGQIRWKELAAEFNEYSKKVNNKPFQPAEIPLTISFTNDQQLLSLSYFKNSFSYLVRGVDNHYKPTRQCINDGFTRLTDGSIRYDKKFRDVTVQEVRTLSTGLIASNPVYSLGNFSQLSPAYTTLFTRFIQYLTTKHIKIEFYLAPFHPVVYNYFRQNKNYRNVFKAERYFRDIAAHYGIKVYGSYDPALCGVNETSFYDGLHCSEKALHQIFANDRN